MSVLVVDVGTSSVRAAIVRPGGGDDNGGGGGARVSHVHTMAVLPSTPFPGLVEFDAAVMAEAVLTVAGRALAEGGPVRAVGIANQRASTVVWDRATGEPVGPGLGWQDLRTVGTCLELQAEGIRTAPNASATKVAALLDVADPDRSLASAGRLAFGTVDSWVAWTLSQGSLHVTDATNAGVSGLVTGDADGWDPAILTALRIPEAMLPTIVASSGEIGPASALPGAPVIAGMAGDQQASMVGQGCLRPGLAKATFGTGGMLDLFVGPTRPAVAGRGRAGTFPIVAWRHGGPRDQDWAVEAIMLTAGACVEWLRDDLGLVESADASSAIAARCTDTGGVWFVPALLGMGTPVWDFGARGAFTGLTRGTDRPAMVRAVLEGVAHRGADLLEAAESDAGTTVGSLRVDGGMTGNAVFVQALADACGRSVAVSREREATTLGAGYLAGMATGLWAGPDEICDDWSPAAVVDPRHDEAARSETRAAWLRARDRALGTIPELSSIDF